MNMPYTYMEQTVTEPLIENKLFVTTTMPLGTFIDESP